MDILGRKKRLEDKVSKMSDSEFEQFMQEDYEKKERRAKWTAIVAGIVTVAAIAALGITGASVGLAVYKIAFGVGATFLLGGTAVGASTYLRRKFKVLKEIKESLNAEIENGKSRKGRTLSLGKQVNKEHKRSKALNRMVKRGQLSKRQAEAYEKINQDVATVAKSGKADFAVTRDAVMLALKSNRDKLGFRIDGQRQDFLANEASNYKTDNSKKSKITVLMRDYKADGSVKTNTDGNEMFTPVVAINCGSDIDMIKSQEIIYDTLANEDVEFPVKVISNFQGTNTTVVLTTKEELAQYKSEFDKKANDFLTARCKAPEAEATAGMGAESVATDDAITFDGVGEGTTITLE